MRRVWHMLPPSFAPWGTATSSRYAPRRPSPSLMSPPPSHHLNFPTIPSLVRKLQVHSTRDTRMRSQRTQLASADARLIM